MTKTGKIKEENQSAELNQEKNHFSTGAENYARHRPTYPEILAENLASLCNTHDLAIEVGCGTGQLSHLLASHFKQVIATDLSQDQINHAVPHPQITYLCEGAEKITAPDNKASLLVAAQAAHWFNLEKFYIEAKRVAKDNATIALLSYGVLHIEDAKGDDAADECFQDFYWHKIHEFWAPDRRHVETGYKEFTFPFKETALPPTNLICEWNLSQLFGYIETWSAIKEARNQGAQATIDQFKQAMTKAWGQPEGTKNVIWPIASRVGHMG